MHFAAPWCFSLMLCPHGQDPVLPGPGCQHDDKSSLKFLQKSDLPACVVPPSTATSGKAGEGTCDDDKFTEGFFFFFYIPSTSFYRKYMLEMKLK